MAILVPAIFLLVTLLIYTVSELYIVNGSSSLCTSNEVSLMCTSRYITYWDFYVRNEYKYYSYYSSYGSYRRLFGVINIQLLFHNSSYAISFLTLTASNYRGSIVVQCISQPLIISLQLNPPPPTEIILRSLPYDGDVDIFSVEFSTMSDISMYSVELSPYSNVTNRNNTYIISLYFNIIYNLTIHLCDGENKFPIGPCPLLSSSSSYQVLQYNVSSNGLQTVSVLRCDWEGEVVVMKCTENGDWKSVNQQLDMCYVDQTTITKSNLNTNLSTVFTSDLSSITGAHTVCLCNSKEIIYSTLSSSTAFIIYGFSGLFIIGLCSCIFLLGFFCGNKYNSYKSLKKENIFNNNQESLEPIYEDVELPEATTGVVIKPNIAYEDVKLQ